MSKEKTKAEAASSPVVSEGSPENSHTNVDIAALQIQIDELKQENARLAAENKAQKELVTVTKKADRTGGKLPRALTHIIGDGRRMINVGDVMTEYECQGLTAGVHYELR